MFSSHRCDGLLSLRFAREGFYIIVPSSLALCHPPNRSCFVRTLLCCCPCQVSGARSFNYLPSAALADPRIAPAYSQVSELHCEVRPSQISYIQTLRLVTS